jgi:hypothetical protein
LGADQASVTVVVGWGGIPITQKNSVNFFLKI